jgi:hypothetical protein
MRCFRCRLYKVEKTCGYLNFNIVVSIEKFVKITYGISWWLCDYEGEMK